jgi:hypothetical protein
MSKHNTVTCNSMQITRIGTTEEAEARLKALAEKVARMQGNEDPQITREAQKLHEAKTLRSLRKLRKLRLYR